MPHTSSKEKVQESTVSVFKIHLHVDTIKFKVPL